MSPKPTDRPATRHAHQRAAAQRAARRRLQIIGGAVAAVIVVAIVLAIALGGSKSKPSTASESTTAGSAAADAAAVVAKLASVPASLVDQIGAGAVPSGPTATAAGTTAITKDGKPELLYIGAEFCPFCAGERWAIIQALSRFGTFSDLALTHSATNDVYPDTATFTFHGSSYTSDYLAFTPVETATNRPDGNGGYTALETPTDSQLAAWKAINPKLSFPFLDIGGTYSVSGASFDVSILQGKTAAQIAEALADPTSPIASSVIGAANGLTAAICKVTGNAPAAVCGAPGVTSAAATLG